MIEYWILWGIGWLMSPRTTLGILVALLGHPIIGILLAIAGFLLDVT